MSTEAAGSQAHRHSVSFIFVGATLLLIAMCVLAFVGVSLLADPTAGDEKSGQSMGWALLRQRTVLSAIGVATGFGCILLGYICFLIRASGSVSGSADTGQAKAAFAADVPGPVFVVAGAAIIIFSVTQKATLETTPPQQQPVTQVETIPAPQRTVTPPAQASTPDEVMELRKLVARQNEELNRRDSEYPNWRTKYPSASATAQPAHAGEVLAAESDVVLISLGHEDGVRPGFEYVISRDGEHVSTIKIRDVQAKKSAGFKLKALSAGEVKVGDKVTSGN